MFNLNKKSHVVTVNPELTVEDYEKLLRAEGMTSGYFPLTGEKTKLSTCLAERIPNFYFLKYGDLADLCVGGKIETPLGRTFSTKIYPRAATGPDLRRVVMGSRGLLGNFREVSFKVFGSVEKEVLGVALMERMEEAGALIRQMMGHFIRPLWAFLVKGEEAEVCLKKLVLPEENEILLIFKLAGAIPLVDAEKESLTQLTEGSRCFLYWPPRREDQAFLTDQVFNPEAFKNMSQKYPSFFGTMASKVVATFEKNFEKHFKETPC